MGPTSGESLFTYVFVMAVVAVIAVGSALLAHARGAARVVPGRLIAGGLVLGGLLLIHAMTLSGAPLFQSPHFELQTVPFRTIGGYLNGSAAQRVVQQNLVGNAVLFGPLGAGFALGGLRLRWSLLALATVGLVVELLQATAGRSGDVDDLILNVSGGLVAAALCGAAVKALPVGGSAPPHGA